MTVRPIFSNISEQNKRAAFNKISAYCDKHLSEALEPFSSGSQWSIKAAFDPENRGRNRYSNVLPWDKSRVSLPAKGGSSDYTNASFVDLGSNRYIAAQGPLQNTVHHFWAMCFSQASETNLPVILIAMVTPLVEQNREKCFRYWPLEQEGTWDMSNSLCEDNLTPNNLKVTWINEDHSDAFIVTKFRLESGDISKIVYHYHYLGWKDTLTPDSVLPLLLLSKNIAFLKQTHPDLVPIVHCSAGVGRTGTFIAVDHFLQSDLDENPESDIVFETVKTLRNQRMMMVQTVHQYLFLYEAATQIYESKKKGRS